jgi:hypothetical protein
MDGKDPGEVVGAGGAHIQALHGLFHHALAQRVLQHVGVHALDALGHFKAKVIRQHHAGKAVADEDLVAQADGLDLAVAVDGIADAHHGVGEVDEPGIRAELLHVMCDLHDRPNIAGGMREAARPAVLGIGLVDAILERDSVVAAPKLFAWPHFDGTNDELRALQCFTVIGVGSDLKLCIPLAVEAVGQAPDDIQALRVAIDQPQL